MTAEGAEIAEAARAVERAERDLLATIRKRKRHEKGPGAPGLSEEDILTALADAGFKIGRATLYNWLTRDRIFPRIRNDN